MFKPRDESRRLAAIVQHDALHSMLLAGLMILAVLAFAGLSFLVLLWDL